MRRGQDGVPSPWKIGGGGEYQVEYFILNNWGSILSIFDVHRARKHHLNTRLDTTGPAAPPDGPGQNFRFERVKIISSSGIIILGVKNTSPTPRTFVTVTVTVFQKTALKHSIRQTATLSLVSN